MENSEREPDVTSAVFRAVERVNEVLAPSQQLAPSRDSLLLEDGTKLDSLAVINVLLSVEDEIRDTFGREITLTGEESDGDIRPESLRTIGTLIEALESVLCD